MTEYLLKFLPPDFKTKRASGNKNYSVVSGFFILTLLVFGIGGYFLETGWPPAVMGFLALVVGAFLFFLLIWLIWLILNLIRKIPTQYIVLFLGTVLALMVAPKIGFRWPSDIYRYAVLSILLLLIVFFRSLYFFKKTVRSSRGSVLFNWAGLVFPILFFVGFVYWLYQDGNDPFAQNLAAPFSGESIPTLSSKKVESPAKEGNHRVLTFTYGSGVDKKRKEYGAGIKFKTPLVDASRLLPEWKGKKKKWRERFWGFGVKNFPLNGRVYMPEGEGEFPLILIVHGNHSMVDYSDEGYAYLGNLLASRGFVVASIDENYINAHWSGDFRGKEMPARAWLLLKHLEQWNNWNNTPGHELENKIDMDKIMLIGHSRGGEAVSIAGVFNKLSFFPDDAREKFDFNFNIKGVVAIAPTDYRYHRQMKLENINYLSLQGSNDSDETSFWGMRPFRRLKFSDDKTGLKAGVYIHHANHGQFNTTWGRSDMGAPFRWLLNTQPLVSGKDQRKAAEVFISAFAEATLRGDESYLPIFKNVAVARDWLPENYYLTHYKNGGSKIFLDFEKDIDPSTGRNHIAISSSNMKIWREENLSTRDNQSQQNNAVVLGWDYGSQVDNDSLAVYNLEFPDSLMANMDSVSELLVSIATGDFKELEIMEKDKKAKEEMKKRKEPDLDFTIRLTDRQGYFTETKISDIKKIAPRLKVRFSKLKSLDKNTFGKAWEVHLEDFILPLNEFNIQDEQFDMAKLKSMAFIFDQSPYGVIVLDDIGFQIN